MPEIDISKPPCAVTYMLELDEAELTVLWGALSVVIIKGHGVRSSAADSALVDECLAVVHGKVTRLLGGF
jgi:hypothetical protein